MKKIVNVMLVCFIFFLSMVPTFAAGSQVYSTEDNLYFSESMNVADEYIPNAYFAFPTTGWLGKITEFLTKIKESDGKYFVSDPEYDFYYIDLVGENIDVLRFEIESDVSIAFINSKAQLCGSFATGSKPVQNQLPGEHMLYSVTGQSLYNFDVPSTAVGVYVCVKKEVGDMTHCPSYSFGNYDGQAVNKNGDIFELKRSMGSDTEPFYYFPLENNTHKGITSLVKNWVRGLGPYKGLIPTNWSTYFSVRYPSLYNFDGSNVSFNFYFDEFKFPDGTVGSDCYYGYGKPSYICFQNLNDNKTYVCKIEYDNRDQDTDLYFYEYVEGQDITYSAFGKNTKWVNIKKTYKDLIELKPYITVPLPAGTYRIYVTRSFGYVLNPVLPTDTNFPGIKKSYSEYRLNFFNSPGSEFGFSGFHNLDLKLNDVRHHTWIYSNSDSSSGALDLSNPSGEYVEATPEQVPEFELDFEPQEPVDPNPPDNPNIPDLPDDASILDYLKQIVAYLSGLLRENTFVNTLKDFTDLFTTKMEMIGKKLDDVIKAIKKIDLSVDIDNIDKSESTNFWDVALELIKSFGNIFKGFGSFFGSLIDNVPNPFGFVGDSIKNKFPIVNQVKDLALDLTEYGYDSSVPPAFNVNMDSGTTTFSFALEDEDINENTVTIIDWSFFSEYRPFIHSILIFLYSYRFVSWLINFIPSLINGQSYSGGDD